MDMKYILYIIVIVTIPPVVVPQRPKIEEVYGSPCVNSKSLKIWWMPGATTNY